MNQIIAITASTIDGSPVQTVNARDLHAFLESKQDFSTWIKARIDQYGFSEGSDYLLHNSVEQHASGAKTRIDYHISTNMAKELSMVERTDKGKEARQYFIECERVAKAAPTAKPVSNAMHYIDILCDSRPKLIDAGFDPDVAFRIANLAAFKETGISVLEAYTDAAPAPAIPTKKPKQGPAWTRGKEFYTVKELAELRGMSVGVINGIISRRGYQTRDSDGRYVITTKGEPMARLTASGILWMHSAA